MVPTSARAPGTRGFPLPFPRLRPWFRARPRSPGFWNAGFHPPQAKGEEARPSAGKQPAQAVVAARLVWESCRQAGLAPLEGTGGADAARLIHCLSAVLPPSSVPPSSSPLGIHLSPPGRASRNDLGGGREGTVQGRKGSFPNDYLLVSLQLLCLS